MCWLSLSIGRTKSLYQPNLQMNVDRNYRMDGLIEICAYYKSFGFGILQELRLLFSELFSDSQDVHTQACASKEHELAE